jgi:hypothetical protein
MEGVEKESRLFFGTHDEELERVTMTSSVAVEELHRCYLDHCDLQKGGSHNGVLLVVSSGRGMGKSLSSLSLLIHKHGRAPKRGIFFGGKTVFADGDHYFDYLTDNLLAGGGRVEKRLSELKAFTPDELADTIMKAVPVRKSDLDDSTRTGKGVIPGLKDYLQGPEQAHLFGGTALLAFEDVNITLDDPTPQLSNQAQKELWYAQLGKASEFFDQLMVKAYGTGVIVIVTTNSLNMAKFFCLLNDNEKAKMFKPLQDTMNFTCQHFDWSVKNRERFLKLQNGLRSDGGKLADNDINAIAHAFAPGGSVREMTNWFVRDCSSRRFPHFADKSKSGDEDDDKKSNWMCSWPPW